MRRRHFDLLRPVCPVCRRSPLVLERVDGEEGGHILEGALLCENADCRREFPIIGGLPILIGPIRDFVREQLPALTAREDLSAATESLLGDCCGPGSEFDSRRQQQSSYAWDHYGEFDPNEVEAEPRPGAIVRLLCRGLDWIDPSTLPPGIVLDLGCGPGRTTFELAIRCGRPVLGIDLNLSLVKLGASVLQSGRLRYPRRRVGVVYDRRELAVPLASANADQVDFWTCDATTLPLATGSAALVTALNLLDSTGSPLALLESIGDVLAPGGRAILACPYDWSAGATPVENWIGGHSQRGPQRGDSPAVLRELLRPGTLGQSHANLRIVAEADNLPWHVRLHERSVVQYRVHLVVVEKSAG